MTQIDQLLLTEPEVTPSRRGLTPGSIVLLVGLLVAVVIVGIALIRQSQTQPTSGPAPDFTLTTLDGQNVKLSDLRGKIVVINFWASWCVPCRDEAPALQAVWDRYQDQDVVILGVAWTDTETGAQAFRQEFRQTYPNGLDLGTKIAEKYHIQGVPETFVVDRQGNVAEFIYANVTETRLSETLDRLLAVS
jgi:cytochrome c biogenesis protein CcmG/thiol:disulfide interchange protein DsbE